MKFQRVGTIAILELRDNYKRYNISVMGTPEGKERRKRRNTWSNSDWELSKIIDRPQVTGTRSSEKICRISKTTLNAYHIETANNQGQRENLEKSKRKKAFTYRGVWTRNISNFSQKTMQARRQWNEIFKALKEKTPNLESYTQFFARYFKWSS